VAELRAAVLLVVLQWIRSFVAFFRSARRWHISGCAYLYFEAFESFVVPAFKFLRIWPVSSSI
jgi:hypothetical protein